MFIPIIHQTEGSEMSDNPFEGMAVISSYSRAQAIEDGVLVDVSQQAREAGFTVPVAMTDTLFHEVIVPDERAKCQDVSGRLWDVFSVLKYHIRGKMNENKILFDVKFVMKEKQPRVIRMKALIGPGDTEEPCLTIMLPEED